MKKMMFNDKFGLTQAVIQGQKTVTRRLISEKCLDKYYDYEDWANSVGVPEGMRITIQSLPQYMEHCNLFPYRVGEVVAVAQKYNDFIEQADWNSVDELAHTAGWTNKMFVKASLMPHQIKILSIRPERLQDITGDNCLREGIMEFPYRTGSIYNNKTYGYGNGEFKAPREAFASLIDKISGKGTWEANPWVWRIEFELIKTKQNDKPTKKSLRRG